MSSASSNRASLLGILKELAEADGPPGREDPVRRVAARHMHPTLRRTRLSPLGSLYAERPSARGGRWMLQASLDEPAFIVSHVDRGGIAWVKASGPVDPEACSGASLRFPRAGRADLGVIPSADGGAARLLADFGGSPPDRPLRIGAMGVFATAWQEDRTTIRSKALDARLGAALALEVAKRTPKAPNTVVLALTALGQVGHRSLPAVATDLQPDAAIALGAYPAPARRAPGATRVHLGKGPVILLRSLGFVADDRLVELLRTSATQARIPIQFAVSDSYSSGAELIRSSGDGVATAAVLVPCSGMGTPQQQVDLRDLEAAVALLVKLLSRPLAAGGG
jgi:endoglucanase